MKKLLRIEMPDGVVFELDAQVVIDDRAKVLANSDAQKGIGDYDEIKTAESFPDDDDILDWIKNNMNWSEIEPFAVERSRPIDKPNYYAIFGDSDITIWR